MSPPDQPPLLCVLSALEDQTLAAALLRHLQPAVDGGRLRLWQRGLVPAGEDLHRHAREHLRAAAVVLPLLSADFYNDALCTLTALPLLRERPDGVVPMRLRAVHYEQDDALLGPKSALPRDGQPLSPRADPDAALAAIAAEVGQLVSRSQPPRLAAGPVPPPQCAGSAYGPAWYVERPTEEREALHHMGQPGHPAVLYGPEDFGKTWLFQHLLRGLRARGVRVVEVDLATLGPARVSLPGLLQALAQRIATGLHLAPGAVAAAFSVGAEPTQAFQCLLAQVLRERESELLLALDRADEMAEGPVRNDFYAQLRALSEDGKEPWPRLRLLLSVSTTPSSLQADAARSPFNLAPPVNLKEFTPAQTAQLCERYRLPWTAAELDPLRQQVGGHPFLLRHVMDQASLHGRPLHELLDDDDLFADHLDRLDQFLRDRPALRAALLTLVTQPGQRMERAAYFRLHRAGLVDGGAMKPRLRCELYRGLVQ